MTTQCSNAKAAFLFRPGKIMCQSVMDGRVFTWVGGPVAKVSAEIAPEFKSLEQDGLLPWEIKWQGYDNVTRCFYVRRGRPWAIHGWTDD